MKPISPTLLNLLTSQQRFGVGELYQFTTVSNVSDYFTSLDIPINFGGNVYKANALRIEGLKYKTAVGWQVDEQDLKISAFPGETLCGSEFLQGVVEGLLDGATLTRTRAFWPVNTGVAAVDYSQTPETVQLFIGQVSTITKIGRTFAELKVKSPMRLLDIEMPRNTYEPGCQWTLFDDSINTGVAGDGCTLLASSFQVSGTVATGYTTGISPSGGVSPVTGGDGAPYWAQGRIQFTSGQRNGFMTVISSNDSVNLYFAFPPIEGISAGDTYIAWPGCAKTGKGGACELKFNNLVNFRGFPRVPPVMVSA